MKYLKVTILLMVMLFFSTNLIAQDQFVRGKVIEAPEMFASGFGATVAGVDLDGDGKLEIYSVSGMSDFMTGDEIPQIIKYELNGTSWDSVWAASLPNERQNTWAALTVGDLDGDGKQEIIWGFTNSFAVNSTPTRSPRAWCIRISSAAARLNAPTPYTTKSATSPCGASAPTT